MSGKVIAAALSALLCASALVSCGSKEDSGFSLPVNLEPVKKVESVDGKIYFRQDVNLGQEGNKALREDFDGALTTIKKEMTDMIARYEQGEAVIPGNYVKFSGDKFEIHTDFNRGSSNTWYEGTYELNDGTLKFSYENVSCTYKNDDGELETSTKDANDVYILGRYNETGTYVDYLDLYDPSRLQINYTVLPILTTVSNSADPRFCPCLPIVKGDIIGHNAYGMKLDKKYTPGKAFTMSFDTTGPFLEDPNSLMNKKEDEEEKAKVLEDWNNDKFVQIRRQLNSDDNNTTITFSDGRWDWYNSEGELINSGGYQESSLYDGLIEMYLTDDSPNIPDERYHVFPPYFLYLDGTEVYYAAMLALN